jgi:assimilatory nitrate reductase catalytic subunit
MGGREVGGLATMLACHLGFSAEERRDVAEFWNAPKICAGSGLKAVDMFRAVHDGRIKFLWVMATNPAVSMPDAGFVREALARCETLVVSDVIADTDTARLAHIRLPALAWGEKDGTVTNSERMISRQRALMAAPGEARADWRIVCDVAARLGHGHAFEFSDPAEVFREYAAMTALSVRHSKLLDLTRWAASSDDEYTAMEPFRWGGEHPLRRDFPTPEGRARLVAVTPPVSKHDAAHPLRLNTGRYRDQWHTMTRTGLSPKLSIHRREPLVEVSGEDAIRFGLEDSGLARVSTPHGEAAYRVRVTDGQRAGEIFAPMHWTDLMASGGRTGLLARPANDPLSGQPGFKDTPATLSVMAPEWHAFMVSRDVASPEALYWARSRIEGGWLTEIAGEGTLDPDVLLPQGLRHEVSDMMRGMRRISVTAPDGALLAALYATRTGRLPERDWIARQFAAQDASPVELLAGRPSAPQPDRGPLVCLCHDVGESELLAAAEAGAETVAAIGAATCAGTNCGSCRPIIARLLEQMQRSMREAAE